MSSGALSTIELKVARQLKQPPPQSPELHCQQLEYGPLQPNEQQVFATAEAVNPKTKTAVRTRMIEAV